MELLEAAASMNISEAFQNLGFNYFYGIEGYLKIDYRKSLYYLEKASERYS